MIHMGCSVYRMSDGSLLAISVPTMYVGCSFSLQSMSEKSVIVLVPAMYVGCSYMSITFTAYSERFSTRDVRGL